MITSEYNSFCTGVDFNQQWMLPWWLSNMYEHHTAEKITICDFGMSESWAEFAKKNCDEYIKFPTRKEMAWFYKPLALAKTKGNKKCWIDLDCEILENISDIFDYTEPDKIACTEDPYHGWGCKWQTGVFAIENNSKLLEVWSHRCINLTNRGDQEILWDIVKDSGMQHIVQLPDDFNWLRLAIEEKKKWTTRPRVIHWTGQIGKDIIKQKIEK